MEEADNDGPVLARETGPVIVEAMMRGHDRRIAPSAALASIVESFVITERDEDAPLIGLPRPEIDLVVRFGPAARGGIDVHARGASDRVRRKVVRGVRRTVSARFRLGAAASVLGVPASAMTGRIAALDALWGERDTAQLLEQLAEAPDAHHATAVLDAAMCARLDRTARWDDGRELAARAADHLRTARGDDRVAFVADALGVSDRHLRRVFRAAFGVGPKTFARIARFERALRDARRAEGGWASVAASAGYFDQAHLIAEFRAIAGVTPTVLLDELGGRELHSAGASSSGAFIDRKSARA